MENFNERNNATSTQGVQQDDFTKREPTNEERWANDVNEEFQEDVPLVNETDPDDDIPLEDDEEDFDEDMPLTDDELAGEVPEEGAGDDEDLFGDDDEVFNDDDELEDDSDDVEFK